MEPHRAESVLPYQELNPALSARGGERCRHPRHPLAHRARRGLARPRRRDRVAPNQRPGERGAPIEYRAVNAALRQLHGGRLSKPSALRKAGKLTGVDETEVIERWATRLA